MSDEADLLQRIHAFLDRHRVLTLAYHDGDGPQACALWFAVDRACVCYFLSTFSTRHGRRLQAGGQVAFTVQKDEQPWQAIRGVQGRGYCAPIEEAALQQNAWQRYVDRFPFVAEQFPDLQAALPRTALWQIRPAWLRLIDNSRGFGHKEELRLVES